MTACLFLLYVVDSGSVLDVVEWMTELQMDCGSWCDDDDGVGDEGLAVCLSRCVLEVVGLGLRCCVRCCVCVRVMQSSLGCVCVCVSGYRVCLQPDPLHKGLR